MSSGVSDIGTQLSRQFLLKILRTDMTSLERQASTGKKTETMSGMGTMGASNAIAYRNKINVNAAYTQNLESAKVQFKVMDNAMNTVADLARDVITTLRKQLQDSVPQATILSNEAQAKLSSVLSALNDQANGRYVFAGDNVYDPPFADRTTLDASMAAQVTGWLAGAPTVASVISDSQTVAGTALGFSANLLSAGTVSFRGDSGTDIEYTTLANLPGFSDILRGISIISNLPQPTTTAEQDNYWTIVNGVISMVDDAAKQVDIYQGMLGVQASAVDDLITKHSENTASYEEFVGDVEDADLADVSIRIQNLQTQLQASYNIVAQVRGLSLVNYL